MPVCSIQYSWYQILSGFAIVVSQAGRIPGQDEDPWRNTETHESDRRCWLIPQRASAAAETLQNV